MASPNRIAIPAAVVVDPYSSGKYLLQELEHRAVAIIAVRSSRLLGSQFLKSHEANKKYFAEFLEYEDLDGLRELTQVVAALPYTVLGVFAGSEPGVELANRLSDALDMPTTNSLELIESRKDKAEMQEALRRNGLPAAEQFKSGALDELMAWAEERNQWPLVAKPTGGAGSDSIFFCQNAEDLKTAHAGIIGNRNPTGTMNTQLALQEFLAGDEYIVDTVSFGGKHICVAIWVYTKAKGLPWNPHAIMAKQNMLLAPAGERQDQLVDYVFKVLDAVGLEYGPCHTEIMLTQRGPILVEVNARLHGLQGPKLIELCTGTSKATYAADTIISGGELFRKLNEASGVQRYLYPTNKQCVQLNLISPVEGFLHVSIKDLITDLSLPSVIDILPNVEKGGFLHQTKDLATLAGTVIMVHQSMEQINADIQKIREAEEKLILYKTDGQAQSTPAEAAVVVDPYSSGKYLLMELEARGIAIIAVRSSRLLGSQFLKSHQANEKYFDEFIEFEDLEELSDLVAAAKALPYTIAGVFAGSEPGVELANRLSDALCLQATNPLELIEARKDKAEMQEALRANGVPAAEQCKSGDLGKLVAWATSRNQWPLVAKPVGGAGSDGIFFCKNEADLKIAHEQIIGQRNPTGVLNNQLALQEFLSGDEYIVDTVSHGGKHICVAIWVCNKVKGLPWNPHAIMAEQNMLLAPSGEKQDQLVDYVFQVLDAVGLKYGPCHTEVMFTERGPILVEVNARLHGLQGPKVIELCTGVSKATYAADTIISNGELFQQMYNAASPGRHMYPVIKQAVNLCLISPVEGVMQNSIREMIAAMNLPSIMEVLPNVEQGGYLSQTTDLGSLAGMVIMVHESMDQIDADIRRIRDAEKSLDLYSVLPSPSKA